MPKPKSPSENGLKNLLLRKGTPTSFPPHKKVQCFQCQKDFYIKFVLPRQEYSQKNNWDYWTGQGKNKKICDSCLLKFYHDKPLYWNMVKDLRKRQQIRTYIYHGIIS